LKIFRQRLRQRQKQNEGMLECGIEEKKKKARIKMQSISGRYQGTSSQ
jgi:hypothetical protein